MDKLREFQAKQRVKKDELEKLIKSEKYELELKHRKEKADLELKHSKLRAQLKTQLYSEREQRSFESKDNKSLKRKARLENDLYELIAFEQENKQKNIKKVRCEENKSVLSDLTNQNSTLVNITLENDEQNQIDNDVINSYQQQKVEQQQPSQLDDSLLIQSIDFNLFETENIAKTLLGLKKL